MSKSINDYEQRLNEQLQAIPDTYQREQFLYEEMLRVVNKMLKQNEEAVR